MVTQEEVIEYLRSKYLGVTRVIKNRAIPNMVWTGFMVVMVQ